jgi:hypothetical protein
MDTVFDLYQGDTVDYQVDAFFSNPPTTGVVVTVTVPAAWLTKAIIVVAQK